ncbi:MAG: SGNH/GDSL hydrolase family protein [Elusimicrobia bacterium]|nr:SGNH/GDSL hydrolase family protein [Elusimicrobiota bacterium]
MKFDNLKKAALLLVLSVIAVLFSAEAMFFFLADTEPAQRFLIVENVYCPYKSGIKYVPSATLGYSVEPNADMGINSLGMFDREYDLKKGAGTYRILVLGDSVTWAARYIYPKEKRYTEILEEKLNESGVMPGYDFEVWNAALSGYSILEYARYLEEKGLKCDPDMILLGINLMDAEWRYYGVLKIFGRGFLAYRRSAAVKDLLANPLCRYSVIYRCLMAYLSGFYYNKDGSAENFKRSIEALEYIRRTGETGNIPVLAVLFPLLKPTAEYSEEQKNMIVVLEHVLGSSGLACLDLVSGSGEADFRDMRLSEVPGDEVHFNARGHEYFGNMITDYVKGRIAADMKSGTRKR